MLRFTRGKKKMRKTRKGGEMGISQLTNTINMRQSGKPQQSNKPLVQFTRRRQIIPHSKESRGLSEEQNNALFTPEIVNNLTQNEINAMINMRQSGKPQQYGLIRQRAVSAPPIPLNVNVGTISNETRPRTQSDPLLNPAKNDINQFVKNCERLFNMMGNLLPNAKELVDALKTKLGVNLFGRPKTSESLTNIQNILDNGLIFFKLLNNTPPGGKGTNKFINKVKENENTIKDIINTMIKNMSVLHEKNKKNIANGKQLNYKILTTDFIDTYAGAIYIFEKDKMTDDQQTHIKKLENNEYKDEMNRIRMLKAMNDPYIKAKDKAFNNKLKKIENRKF